MEMTFGALYTPHCFWPLYPPGLGSGYTGSRTGSFFAQYDWSKASRKVFDGSYISLQPFGSWEEFHLR